MTEQELYERMRALHVQIKNLKREKAAVAHELEQMELRKQAERKVAQMSEAERAALAQVIRDAGGIEGASAVGTP
jgi:ABC-type cobalamin/Fe3+-siderophores transport system ATPase subunit